MWDLLRPGIKPMSQAGRQILNHWITRVAQYFATFYSEFSLTQTIDPNHSSHITVTELSKLKAQRGWGGISVSITFEGFPPRHLDSTRVMKNSPLSTKWHLLLRYKAWELTRGSVCEGSRYSFPAPTVAGHCHLVLQHLPFDQKRAFPDQLDAYVSREGSSIRSSPAPGMQRWCSLLGLCFFVPLWLDATGLGW